MGSASEVLVYAWSRYDVRVNRLGIPLGEEIGFTMLAGEDASMDERTLIRSIFASVPWQGSGRR